LIAFFTSATILAALAGQVRHSESVGHMARLTEIVDGVALGGRRRDR